MWDWNWYLSHGTLHSIGVLVLINSHLGLKVLSLISDQFGRYIPMKGIQQDLEIMIHTNVYLQVRGKVLQRLEFLPEFEERFG